MACGVTCCCFILRVRGACAKDLFGIIQKGKIYSCFTRGDSNSFVYSIAIGCSYNFELIFIFTGAYHNAASDNAMRDYRFAYK